MSDHKNRFTFRRTHGTFRAAWIMGDMPALDATLPDMTAEELPADARAVLDRRAAEQNDITGDIHHFAFEE
jgi:hypothetical protein